MNLEKKVNGNGRGFLKKIVRKAMPYVLVAGLGLAVMGCQDPPGPISVQNNVNPSIAQSGSNVSWEIEVTNYGNKVEIERATFHEKAIGGWAAGIYDISGDLPITNTIINANSTKVIFSRSVPVYNMGDGSDIIFENIVTITSDGGDDSDTCTYTVVSSNSYSSLNFQPKSVEESSMETRGVAHNLSDYMGK